MDFPAVVASLSLGLALFPHPLLWLDAVYRRVLARSIVRVSEGAVDLSGALERIRRAEVIEPRDSARLFAVLCLVGAVAAGAFGGRLSGARATLAVVAALLAGGLALRSERYPWARLAAAIAGAAGIIAIRSAGT